jgi:hypothetical protein
VREVGEVEPGQKIEAVLAQRPLLAGRAEPQHRAAEPDLAHVVGAGHHVFEDGERREERHVLERAGQPPARDLVRGHREEVAPVEPHGAVARLVEPAEHVEERGLAGAVRPDERTDRAGLDVEGELVEGDDTAEAHPHVVDGQ